MIELPRITLLLAAIMSMVACTSNPRVQSDYDHDLDFGHYRTFNFSSRTEIEDPDLADDLELYFSAAVMEQLLARGLVRSAQPDILINVAVDIEDVSRPPAKARNCPSYEDYYSRRVADSYSGEGRRPMCIYIEGSVEIDMIDVRENRTIWEGVSRVRMDEDDRGTALLRSVATDVATMFDRPERPQTSPPSGYLRPLPQFPKPVSE